MNPINDERKWFRRKRYLLPILLGGAILSSSIFYSGDTIQTQPAVVKTQSVNSFDVFQTQPIKTEGTVNNNSSLSNSNYYTNVNGNTVHSPAYTEDNSVPQGATAQCRDGTYSFSQNHRGTCSHHGGVSNWLN